MTHRDPLQLALDYHRAWNERRFTEAAACLADDLQIEVPINSYPTKASFMSAVQRTRAMTTRVETLAELGDAGSAMLLYDMTLPFGVMRVAEHFTVAGGRIARIRQIHDTTAIRAALAAAS